ncbi:hypothetical protein [Streptomyces sp. NPDC005281]|uniref:hypothetical protein n=1 Tax=Streptomyces sp. NPDC005281 TaxID=3155712 RepID=UPI0033B0FD5C
MTQPSIEQQQQLNDELRELIREAHGVLKDIRREKREARELLPLLTDELFSDEVKKQLAALNKVTKQAMDDAVARVFKKFDELGAIVMGEDRISRRKGKPSIPSLVNARAGKAGRD